MSIRHLFKEGDRVFLALEAVVVRVHEHRETYTVQIDDNRAPAPDFIVVKESDLRKFHTFKIGDCGWINGDAGRFGEIIGTTPKYLIVIEQNDEVSAILPEHFRPFKAKGDQS